MSLLFLQIFYNNWNWNNIFLFLYEKKRKFKIVVVVLIGNFLCIINFSKCSTCMLGRMEKPLADNNMIKKIT